MGYNTTFKGELKFTKELTASQLAKLSSMLSEDCRDHPEWNAPDLTYIDLRLLDDFSGLEWDYETEKTYELEELVNVVITEMQKEYPDFGLTGKLVAQGEEVDDRWELIIKDGRAIRKDVAVTGKIIICPLCEGKFELE